MAENLADILRQSIHEQDWAKVEQVCDRMSAETEAKPVQPKKRPRTKKVETPSEPVPEQEGSMGGRRVCRVLPFEAPRGNIFKDNRREAKEEIATDRKLTRKMRPCERRPPAREIQVTCSRCGKKEVVTESLAPAALDGERMSYVCTPCISSGIPR